MKNYLVTYFIIQKTVNHKIGVQRAKNLVGHFEKNLQKKWKKDQVNAKSLQYCICVVLFFN